MTPEILAFLIFEIILTIVSLVLWFNDKPLASGIVLCAVVILLSSALIFRIDNVMP